MPRKLIVKGPTYFSQRDEDLFYQWLDSIPSVGSVGGKGYEVHIELKRQPSKADLRELLALFFRYRMDMEPLAALKTARNEEWFAGNEKAFWHRPVFGPKRKT